MKSYIAEQLAAHRSTVDDVIDQLQPAVLSTCELVIEGLARGGKVVLFGNGGSAADAQHIAAEIVGCYETQRRGLPAIALTTDTSALTSISNDYGFGSAFERQVEALCRPDDVLIGISTSGNSENVNRALDRGRALGCRTIGLIGRDGGAMTERCDVAVVVPAAVTSRIQEMHILVGHIICGAVDRWHDS